MKNLQVINHPSERIVWLDMVRLVAFLLLMACHATDPVNAGATYGNGSEISTPNEITWATFWGSFVRPCVPLFVMLTGALLLPVREGMSEFYRRRIPRVLYPFIIWSVLYYLTPWFTGLLGADRSIVYYLFCWAESDSQSLSDGMANVLRIPFSFSYLAGHMWYIFLLIGLYLYLPVFSAWVAQATKRQKEWVLALWAVSTFLPYFHEFVSPYGFGTCSWNSYGTFYYFAGFSGYLLLGHYVKEYVEWGVLKSFCIALPLVVVGMVTTYFGFKYMNALPEPTPEQVELFWTYCTPNVAMMSFGWIVLLKRVRISSSRVCAALSHLTICGFGVYMAHYFFMRICYDCVKHLSTPTPLQIPLTAVLMLLVSWLFVSALKRILGRYSRYLVG